MATSGFIGIDVRGLEELKKKFDKLGPEGQDLVVDDVTQYVLDVMRQYPSEKRVTRKAAYGFTFFTDKQRRFFFAALKSGDITIPYNRTQTFRRNWKQIGKGRDSIIANETKYGGFLMGDGEQSRHAMMIGWQSVDDKLDKHNEKLIEKADGAIKKAIKKVGLK